ncbi:MAG: MBOAT family O-acyltransferase [Cyanobacteria bacterium P01_A01_bin.116]
MIFSSVEFFAFFAAVLLFLSLAKGQHTKKLFLLAASYFFYGYWDWRFTFLMLAMTVVNYALGQVVEQSGSQVVKRLGLWSAIAFDLGVLGFFKYYNFFIESANGVLRSLGMATSSSSGLSTLEIILPVGISFITFQVMAYVTDIYRGVTKSADTFWDFALLTAFFPQLVAGPILKAKQFLPELNKKIEIKPQNLLLGMQLFLLGMFRKIVIADRLALYVDSVFDQPQDFSSATIWLAVIAYAIQIYCDFSGYSDMAIGAAKCLGYDIPINFNIPYLSRSITEFWRRWHISLSTWLREYLYIPLGGNRKGKVRQYLNLWLVMLIGGLWHGASWNFVLWGALHGTALAVHKFYADYVRSHIKLPPLIYNALMWAVTFLFVCTTWVLFRATDFSAAFVVLQKMYTFVPSGGISWYSTGLLIAIPGIFIADTLGSWLNRGRFIRLNRFSHRFWLSFWLLGLLFLAPQNPQPFVYFQF